MSFIKKLGVFFLSVIVIFLLIILSFSFTLSSFLYPQVYFTAFEQAGLYQYVGDSLENSPNMFILIPESGARTLVENLFSNFLAYMRSDTSILDLTVQVDQQKLRSFFLGSISNLSQCNTGQNPFNENNPCIPKGMSKEEYLDAFLESKNLSFFESDKVDLSKVYGIEVGSEGRKQLDEIRRNISYYKFSSILVIIIILVLYALIFLLQKPNMKKFIRTIGITLIIPALILIILNLSLNNITNFLTFPDPLFVSLIEIVKGVITSKLSIYSIVIGGLGIVLFIASFFINSNLEEKTKTSKKKL